MTELRKWKFSDIWAWLKNAALATLKGELLLRLHVSRYFIHIIYTFFLFWVSIWLSLRIEKTLTRVEDNRKVLADMEIYHAQKTVELAGLSRMSKVQAMLEESGSKLTMPATSGQSSSRLPPRRRCATAGICRTSPRSASAAASAKKPAAPAHSSSRICPTARPAWSSRPGSAASAASASLPAPTAASTA